MSSAPRTVLLSDLHLVRDTPRAVSLDLAGLVRAHPGARLVFLGDLFDLPAVSPRPPRAAVVEALGAHPEARAALARHIDGGGELWLLGGNHDAEVGTRGFDDHLVAALGASPSASRGRVRTSPWFFREGAVHLEHGHFYDPDNAPAHPLVNGAPSLGVHLMQEFVAPAGAHRYAQETDGTPLKLFMSSFAWYGPRTPYVIYKYFHAAFQAMLRSGPFYRASSEPVEGAALIEAFARELGVPRELVDAVLLHGATPTLESLSRTFTRLYFDRVIATLALTGGLGAALAGHRTKGAAAAALGGLLMLVSWSRGHNRYGGAVPERLEACAARVARATGAKLVIFGHTHREAHGDLYANTGSFAFPRGAPGRPFLELERATEAPVATRRYWPASV